MNQQIADILDHSAGLIETKGWTQGAWARGKNGERMSATMEAECYCVIGAIRVACGNDLQKEFHVVDFAMKTDFFQNNIVKFNDDPARTKEEVVAALKAAAELARKNG